DAGGARFEALLPGAPLLAREPAPEDDVAAGELGRRLEALGQRAERVEVFGEDDEALFRIGGEDAEDLRHRGVELRIARGQRLELLADGLERRDLALAP